jgi:hypothetical protein
MLTSGYIHPGGFAFTARILERYAAILAFIHNFLNFKRETQSLNPSALMRSVMAVLPTKYGTPVSRP